jgi:hypothetical protein
MKTYRDDDEQLRCLECDGYLAEGATKCKKCQGRRDKEIERQAAAQRLEDAAEERKRRSEATASWRRRRLARYTNKVLALSSEERQAFFDSNPIRNIFS